MLRILFAWTFQLLTQKAHQGFEQPINAKFQIIQSPVVYCVYLFVACAEGLPAVGLSCC